MAGPHCRTLDERALLSARSASRRGHGEPRHAIGDQTRPPSEHQDHEADPEEHRVDAEVLAYSPKSIPVKDLLADILDMRNRVLHGVRIPPSFDARMTTSPATGQQVHYVDVLREGTSFMGRKYRKNGERGMAKGEWEEGFGLSFHSPFAIPLSSLFRSA